jgi:huntingtin interacting protein 1
MFVIVFSSLDMSRSNSMTSSGQCRLAPLIPCIQDSSQLYDYCVKMLFKLHEMLPPDVLSGHRERFLKIFKDLKQFYINASNLQYFKNLIQIPLLPDVSFIKFYSSFFKTNIQQTPPNFLQQSELRTYVTPVVVLPEDNSNNHESLENFAETSDLVDLNSLEPPPIVERNPSPPPPAIPPLPDIVAQR